MIKRMLRKVLPRKTYEPVRRFVILNNLYKKIANIRKDYRYCIIFIATPLHGNLGDQAIVYSQERFFCDMGLEKHIVEIPASHYQRYSNDIKKMIRNEDIIIVDGGGNMGTIWMEVEHKMQNIVINFPNNSIFFFPQTIFYSNNSQGELELQKSKDIYTKHKDLHICAREKASYEFMKKNYPLVDILLVPDIVLYLNQIYKGKRRKGAVLCLRQDREKKLDDSIIKHVIKELKGKKLEMTYESTVIPGLVSNRNRFKKLNKKWMAFSKAQIVVTDRLHGMIFAAITGTPCLAFDNSSGKVGNVYEWIKDLKYIHYIRSIDENIDIMATINEVIRYADNSYGDIMLKQNYYVLVNSINNVIRQRNRLKGMADC